MRMKKKRHGNDRIELLSDLFCEQATDAIAPDGSVYAGNAPLRVEIGCGKGDFVRQLSVKEPNYNYLAIEKISDVAIVAAEKYAISRGLGDKAPNGGWVKADPIQRRVSSSTLLLFLPAHPFQVP